MNLDVQARYRCQLDTPKTRSSQFCRFSPVNASRRSLISSSLDFSVFCRISHFFYFWRIPECNTEPNTPIPNRINAPSPRSRTTLKKSLPMSLNLTRYFSTMAPRKSDKTRPEYRIKSDTNCEPIEIALSQMRQPTGYPSTLFCVCLEG